MKKWVSRFPELKGVVEKCVWGKNMEHKRFVRMACECERFLRKNQVPCDDPASSCERWAKSETMTEMDAITDIMVATTITFPMCAARAPRVYGVSLSTDEILSACRDIIRRHYPELGPCGET